MEAWQHLAIKGPGRLSGHPHQRLTPSLQTKTLSGPRHDGGPDILPPLPHQASPSDREPALVVLLSWLLEDVLRCEVSGLRRLDGAQRRPPARLLSTGLQDRVPCTEASRRPWPLLRTKNRCWAHPQPECRQRLRKHRKTRRLRARRQRPRVAHLGSSLSPSEIRLATIGYTAAVKASRVANRRLRDELERAEIEANGHFEDAAWREMTSSHGVRAFVASDRRRSES